MECKEERGIIMRKSVFVLIETLWNVKHKKKTCETPAPGINRNIMECKVSIANLTSLYCEVVLIETLWNVKYHRICTGRNPV